MKLYQETPKEKKPRAFRKVTFTGTRGGSKRKDQILNKVDGLMSEVEEGFKGDKKKIRRKEKDVIDIVAVEKTKAKDYDVREYAQGIFKKYEADLQKDPEDFQAQFGKIIDWGNINVDEIVEKLVETLEVLCNIKLFPYQKIFAARVMQSVLLNDGEEVTACWSRQSGKCFGRGTEIRMWDGTVKCVENIKEGDILLGDDNTPRKVLSIHYGVDKLYKVVPQLSHGEAYIVNSGHILSLRRVIKNRIDGTNLRNNNYVVQDVSLSDFVNLSDYQKNEKYKGFKAAVEWPEQNVEIEPYFLGLWLGDGKARDQSITSEDGEIIQYLYEYANRLGLKVSKYEYDEKDCADYGIVTDNHSGARNPLRDALKELFLNKHIPLKYFRNSKNVRRELLAGIIDSDGHKSKCDGKENTCELVFKDGRLAKDVCDLARSLGLRASIQTKRATIKSIGYVCEVYRIMLYGDLTVVPTKVARKRWVECSIQNDPLAYGIKIEALGEGEFFGFKTDGNHRFLLGDFTVAHNSETIADVLATLMVMLPIFSQYFPQLKQFKDGVYIGVFAPTEPQAKTIGERFRLRIRGDMANEFLRDPEVGVVVDDLWMSNGSYCRIHSAAPQTKVESKTYHIIVIDEAQDVADDKILKSIHPMAAATSGTIIKLGTPHMKNCEFLEAIKRNKRIFQSTKGKVYNHFEFDYKVVCRYNERYKKFVEKERSRYGEDSDYFRMSYKLEWLLEKGMAITSEMFENGMRDVSLHLEKEPDHRFMYVAGLDLGKKYDSTVLTIIKLFRREKPPRFLYHDFDDDDQVSDVFLEADMYQKKVVAWFEWEGDNWESQVDDIVRVIERYETMQTLSIDSTGVGDPIHEMISRRLANRGISVIPYYFTLANQHKLAQLFYKNLNHGNIAIPSHASARKTRKFIKFSTQLLEAEKIWKNDKMIIRHGVYKGAKDDYVQSLFLGLHSAEESLNMGGMTESPNIFTAERTSEDRFNQYSDVLETYDISELHGFDEIRRAAREGRLVVKKATFHGVA